VAGAAVPGFLPSQNGFHFANDFPHVPLRSIGIPGVVRVPIGDASNGLCGGMAFAVRDYLGVNRPVPADTTPPSSGPLFDYLVRRLFDSFMLPVGPLKYLALMNPALPDGESFWSRLGIGPHGRAWRMVREEWPKVRDDIEAGVPSPLGLVRVKSANPMDLGQDHQVLAYAYDLTGTRLVLRLYDPNWPDRDDVTMSLDVADPTHPIAVTTHPDTTPVYAFFRVDYRPATPP
jgi:hypothetical protein